jgi:hypothetical protein
MGLFSRKQKVNIFDFCQDLYDSKIFYPIIAGQDFKWLYIDTAYNKIIEIDKLFNSVDRSIFRKEMMAVRMEVIGLAFKHQIKNKEILLNQSLFTRDYLIKNAESELWEIMGDYNKVIAMSSTKGANKFTIDMINSVRASLFEEYMKKYFKDDMDGDCVSYICNREACDVAWKQQVTARQLTYRLEDRVGCSEYISLDIIMPILTLIWGFYHGAKEAINLVSFE